MQRIPSSQDVSWFLDQNARNQLDLDPPYQRRSVWTLKDRKYFMDTVFRGYPCPPVFLHKSIDDNGVATHHVVDGKQRLETIIMFTQDKFAIDKDFGSIDLDGKKWSEIGMDWKRKFWNYVVPVEYIDTVEGSVVKEIFDRFNRNARKLEPQELRHAKYDGWLISLAESEAGKSEWTHLAVVTTARAKRMKDVQFISELLIVLLEENIFGFDQEYLDRIYAKYDNPDEIFDETKTDFSETDFTDKLERVKSYIIDMQKANKSVTRFAKSFANFYSLWSFVSLYLNKLPNAEKLAANYQDFMEKVEGSNDIDDSSKETGSIYNLAIKYKKNTLGASTDLSPRQARHEALTEALISKQ